MSNTLYKYNRGYYGKSSRFGLIQYHFSDLGEFVEKSFLKQKNDSS